MKYQYIYLILFFISIISSANADQKCDARYLHYHDAKLIHNDLLMLIGRASSSGSAYISTAKSASTLAEADKALTNGLRTTLISQHAAATDLLFTALVQDLLIRDAINSKTEKQFINELASENLSASVEAAKYAYANIFDTSEVVNDDASKKLAADLLPTLDRIKSFERYCK